MPGKQLLQQTLEGWNQPRVRSIYPQPTHVSALTRSFQSVFTVFLTAQAVVLFGS